MTDSFETKEENLESKEDTKKSFSLEEKERQKILQQKEMRRLQLKCRMWQQRIFC